MAPPDRRTGAETVTRAAAALLLFVLAAHAQAPRPIASYDIRATLDPAKRTITGSQTLTWVNDSPDTVPTLQFHLYLNAFKNEQSTFIRGLGGRLGISRPERIDWGYVEIRSLKLAGGEDLTGKIRFIQPGDGNPHDQTVIEVPLPAPVPPGGIVSAGIDFVSKLPRLIARTGYHGDFHLAGQWFPKLGVWETRGFRQRPEAGWNCHQFHANSEFYANFGNYRVTLTAPLQYEIGATGIGKSRLVDETAGKATWVFEQEMATDFAFTAQPGFVRLERDFDPAAEITAAERAAAASLLGLPETELALPPTRMILLLQPEHRDQAERQFRALKHGIKWFGLWYGPYPHPAITLVDPPFGGMQAGGMEYPAFITGGTRWREPEDYFNSDETVVHEFGHQYFKELIATNEFEEPWLDEGLTHYVTTKIMEREYGPSRIPFRIFGWNLSKWLRLPLLHNASVNRIGYLANPVIDDLQRFSWDYYDGASYGLNAYPRAAITLKTLENLLGEQTMARVLRAYATRYRFGHPSSRDFQAVAEEVSGRDLDWFFRQFVFGSRLLDYAVADVESRPIEQPLGLFDNPETGEPELRKERGKPPQPEMFESTVSIRRLGDAVAPVKVRVTFENGEQELREWDGQYRWVRYTFLRPVKIARVAVDPDRHYDLDVNFANNSWQSEPQSKALTHWSGTLVFWLQNLFLWTGALL